jgi:hypothetical protein
MLSPDSAGRAVQYRRMATADTVPSLQHIAPGLLFLAFISLVAIGYLTRRIWLHAPWYPFRSEQVPAAIGAAIGGVLAGIGVAPLIGGTWATLAGSAIVITSVVWGAHAERKERQKSITSADAVSDANSNAVLTPQYLKGLFAGRTTAQGSALADRHIGEWMTVTGPFGDVYPLRSGSTRFMASFAPSLSINFLVFIWFNAKWKDQVGALRPGEQITVRGKINDVGGFQMNLYDCEIVSVG